ncbi:hypothetical protein HPB47_016627, partial [Ixodes persulcatus]
VDIGKGVLVDQASLLLAQGKRDALFVKDLAVAVYGSRLLMNSSVLDVYVARLVSNGMPERFAKAATKDVTRFINEKITELRRHDSRRSLLCAVLRDPSKPLSDNRQLRDFLGIINQTMELLWQRSLHLRGGIPKQRPVATCDVKTSWLWALGPPRNFSSQVYPQGGCEAYPAMLPVPVPDYYLHVHLEAVPRGDEPYVISASLAAGTTGIPHPEWHIAAPPTRGGPLWSNDNCSELLEVMDVASLAEDERWNDRTLLLLKTAVLRTVSTGELIPGALPTGQCPYPLPHVDPPVGWRRPQSPGLPHARQRVDACRHPGQQESLQPPDRPRATRGGLPSGGWVMQATQCGDPDQWPHPGSRPIQTQAGDGRRFPFPSLQSGKLHTRAGAERPVAQLLASLAARVSQRPLGPRGRAEALPDCVRTLFEKNTTLLPPEWQIELRTLSASSGPECPPFQCPTLPLGDLIAALLAAPEDDDLAQPIYPPRTKGDPAIRTSRMADFLTLPVPTQGVSLVVSS